jgi:hypothetical protein
MKLKIHNSEVISYRVSGELYFEIMRRINNSKMTVGEYAYNALIKHMRYDDSKNHKGKGVK